MVAYEFSTHLVDTEAVVIPPEYARKLQKGAPVRVILLVEEKVNGEVEESEMPADLPSLEEIVAKIQRMGPNPNNITPASGLLAEKLAHPLTEPDSTFDLEVWTRDWDYIEAHMKTQSLAHEEAECQEWVQ